MLRVDPCTYYTYDDFAGREQCGRWKPGCDDLGSRCIQCCGRTHTALCLVQLYYELAAEREKQGKQGEIAIVRLEQLAPFPFDLVMRELRRYPNAEVMWCASHCPLPQGHLPCMQSRSSPEGAQLPLQILCQGVASNGDWHSC